MKNLKFILLLFILAVVASIIILLIDVAGKGIKRKGHRVDINCTYPGAIIYHKYDWNHMGIPVRYDIKYQGKIIKGVRVYAIDAGYDVGDTINKPCLNN